MNSVVLNPLLFYFLIFVSSMISFSLNWTHLLSALVLLEFMVISLYASLSSLMSLKTLTEFDSLVFLTIAVCEGVLGVSVLIMLVRSSGNELLSTQTVMKW
uniref:NADH dehydrogenase subunit 4L n=1 Tax=Pleurocryptella fimbriata TaxID=2480055 RepID=A0A8K1Y3K6_9CRUS|nr:NADH dehydrogenase subunit 4L [Pleurocryptella fimbriata]